MGFNSPSEGKGVFRLVLLVAFLLPVVETIAGILLSRAAEWLIVFGPQGAQNVDLLSLVDVVQSLGFFIVVPFIVFYFIGTGPGIEIHRDYIRLLQYTFIGSLLGYLVGYTASIGVVSLVYGSAFDFAALDLTTAVYAISFVLGVAGTAIQAGLVAFAAISIGSLRRTPKITDSATTEPRPTQDAELDQSTE